jgi:hypothetical protein
LKFIPHADLGLAIWLHARLFLLGLPITVTGISVATSAFFGAMTDPFCALTSSIKAYVSIVCPARATTIDKSNTIGIVHSEQIFALFNGNLNGEPARSYMVDV